MRFTENPSGQSITQISALFNAAFSASEGAEEGIAIGELSKRILAETPEGDVAAFIAKDSHTLTGAVLFSRMRYAGEPRSVWLLAPMAVAPKHQRQGIGQQLINTALEVLRERGVEILLTYGDPAFYGKTGFSPITESDVPAPFSLSMPEGWLGQSLNAQPIGQIKGPAQCIEALNDPVYW